MAERALDDRGAAGRGGHAARFEPWPWVLVVLIAAMIGTSLGLWAIAASHPDGVVGDAWEAGLAFNDELAARRRAAARGAFLETSAVPTAEGAHLRVRVGGPARVDRVVAERIRPAEAGLDAELALRLEGGVWSADVPLPEPGRWRFRVRADLDEGHLEREIAFFHAPGGAPEAGAGR